VTNDLSSILPKILARGLVTLRELAMMPQLVNSDYGAEAAEKGNVINVPIPTAQVASDVVAAAVPPAPADNAIATVPITLDQWKKSNFGLTDKDMTEIDTRKNFIPMQTNEAIRALANAVNAHIFTRYKGTGVAQPGIFGFTGTPGVTPFAISDKAAVDSRKVLARQLCPKDNRRFVLDFDAEANAVALPSFKDVSQSADMLVKVEGRVGRKFGFDFYSDDIVPTHTAGTAAGFLVNKVAGGVVGDKSIPLDTGAGTILLGDIATFAGQTQTYIVTAFDGTTLSFYPGLKAVVADNTAVTIQAAHVVNLAFHRDCLAFANRSLESAQATAAGATILTLQDPITGISMRLEVTRQYKQVMWEFDLLWGSGCARPELGMRLAG
jgi:hypothetical protein